MYTIEVKSDFEELYRYNIIATCAGYSATGESLYVVGEELIYNEQVQEDIYLPTPPPPPYFHRGEVLRLECPEAESIHAIVYVVTAILPENRVIAASPPFDVEVKISRSNKILYNATHKANQWGGATITIKLPTK